jgi:hypothetical protein
LRNILKVWHAKMPLDARFSNGIGIEIAIAPAQLCNRNDGNSQ